MKVEQLLVRVGARVALCVAAAFGFECAAFGDGGAAQMQLNKKFISWHAGKHAAEKQSGKKHQTTQRGRLLGASEEGDTEEFATGAMPSTIDFSYLTRLNQNGARAAGTSYPARYDLRDEGFVTSVKDQGNYGTCWAHATMASLESYIKKTEGLSLDFSENYHANMHGFDWGFSAGGNGNISMAALARWEGPVLEEDDPYGRPNKSVKMPARRHVQQMRIVPPKVAGDNTANDAIKEALMKYGAMYVSYWHNGRYLGADGKSFNCQDSYETIDTYLNYGYNYWHAVTLVGWDDNYPRENFANPARGIPAASGNGAYIMKNSWGTSVGERGYFYVSYYDTQFARDEIVAFVNADPVSNYGKIYEYDPLGWVGTLWQFAACKAWGANIFTATGNDEISAVGFYAPVPDTSVGISVYTGVASGKPASGTLAVSQRETVDSAGYYTIPLDKGVKVNSGSRFSIVLEIKTPGYSLPLAVECVAYQKDGNGGEYEYYSSEATSSNGQSFFSTNGSTWYDMNQQAAKYRPNFCCKAYTKSAAAAKPTLSSIAIAGVSSLTSGKSAQFSCSATYSDGSKKTVSPTWSVERSSQGYASVSASGLVTAKDVQSQQTATVKASYAEDGTTKTDTWSFFVTVAAPGAPSDVAATQGTDTSCVRVSWPETAGATEYAVYRAAADNSRNAQYLGNVNVPRYSDTDAAPGTDYWYFVKAKNASGSSGFSAGASGWRKLSPPENVVASDTLLDKVAVQWSDVEGAKCYRVYRADSIDGEKSPLGGWQTAATFDDTTAVAGKAYCYFVVAAVDANGNRPSEYSIVEDGMRAVPVTLDRLTLTGVASIPSGGSATYSAQAEYTDGTKKTVSASSWRVSPTTYASVSAGKVTAKTVSQNQTIKLTATYSEGGKTATGSLDITITANTPGVPSGLVVKSQTLAGISLSWSGVADASSYAVYRSAGGATAVKIGSVTATSYTDSSATPGVSYSYSVSSVNGAGESNRSSAVAATMPLSAPSGVAATSDRTDGVQVSWQTVNGATHYRVARATSATGAKTELGSWQAATAYTDTSATAGTRYYYFVRAATGSSGANASGYSAAAQGTRKVAVTLQSIAVSGPDKVSASKTAMYSCAATYSDGTTKAVAPSWSATGAASIDSNGKLTANSVSVNSTATVTATFTDGTTRTVSKSVAIVAPVKATAEIKNVRVTTRWPFRALLDIDYDLVTAPASAKASIGVFGRDEDHGIDMAATSLAGDGADGSFIQPGSHRLTWDIAADYPDFHSTAFSVSLTATPSVIAVPENFAASSSTSGVTLSWSPVEDATGYEIWRGTGTTTNGAARIATVANATSYADATGTPGTANNYWLRAYTDDGFGDFSAAISAVRTVIVPVSLTISGAASVVAGASSAYTCTATLNDGTSREVAADWSIASGSAFASIDAAGLLTTKVENGTASLQAAYTLNGTTVTATKSVLIETRSVTVTFYPNGGTVSNASGVYTLNATYGSLPLPVRSGYVFDGWHTSASGGVRVSTWSTVSLTDKLYAHWLTDNGIVWTISNNGTLTKVALNGNTSATIPGYVTGIGTDVFWYCRSSLTSVTIPNSVTNIGISAFSGCGGLTSVTIPNSVKSIRHSAFQKCNGLTSVTIPDGITSIEECTFYDCSGLKGVTIPNSVTNIEDSAFEKCSGLTNVTIPDSVTSIGMSAFSGCSGLTSVTIGSGVKTIDSLAFDNCSNLQAFYVSSDNTNYSSLNGVLYNRNKTTLIVCPGGLTSVTIPNSVTRIGDYAFYGCSGLTNVTIQSGGTTINVFVFSACKNLKTFDVNSDNTNYSSLNGVLYNRNKTSLIACPRGLTSVTIPNSVTSIGGFAFYGCSGLTSVTIPNSVTSIVTSAFKSCSGLTSVTIPNSVTSIGSDAFKGCSGLTSVTIGSGVMSIKQGTFEDCSGLTSVTIPNSVTSIGEDAFRGCSNLTSVTIPDSVRIIERYAFDDCSGLTRVTIGSGVTSIGSWAFSCCSALTRVTIGSGVTSIGSWAFYGCSGLTSVTIPDSVTSIGREAFRNCSGLTSVTIKGALSSYTSSSGIYDSTPSSLVTYVTSKWTGPTDTWNDRKVVVLDE